ncbi:hypothetical protein ID866_3497, partial [Astraeus odoratus]
MIWLVVFRVVQGIDSGWILQLVQTTVSDIVSLQEYVFYNASSEFPMKERKIWRIYWRNTGNFWLVSFLAESAIIPLRLSKARTTGAILISAPLHAFMFFSVLGASATNSGVGTIPFSLTGAVILGLTLLVLDVSTAQDPTLRAEVMHAYARSISTVWRANTPLSPFGFLVVLMIKAYTLERPVVQGGAKVADAEVGAAPQSETESTGST